MLKHLILSLSLLLSPFLTAQESLIPKPVSYQAAEGSFTLTKNTALKVEAKAAKSAANYLSERLKTVAGIDLENADNAPNSITFKTAQLNGKAVSGTYKLSVTDQSVTIEAADQSGFFYGAITLLQLMPAEVWSRETLKKEELTTFPVHAALSWTIHASLAWHDAGLLPPVLPERVRQTLHRPHGSVQAKRLPLAPY